MARNINEAIGVNEVSVVTYHGEVMDLHNEDHIDYDLIALYLSGEASESEEVRIKSWVEASENNAALFATLKSLWVESSPNHFEETSDEFSVNTDVAWNKVQQRIQPTKTRSIRFERLLKIAAVLVVGLSVAYIAFDSFEGGSKQVAVASGEKTLTVPLSDGSKIELNANSTLSHPDQFNGSTREVVLEGEAFFEIEPDSTKPFIIKANEVDIKVLGTSFNVGAFAEDSVEVQVETGLVEMANSGSTIQLRPGETGVYYTKRHKLIKRERKVLSSQFWRNRRLTFRRTTLADVVNTLNDLYQVNIQTDGMDIDDKKINVRFEDQDLDLVLEIVASTLDLEVEYVKTDTIVLRNAN